MNAGNDDWAWISTDQREVAGLFEAYDALCARNASELEKTAVTDRIRQLLSVRAQVEDEVLAPALRQAKLDLKALDARLQQRRSELMAQHQADRRGCQREDESADPVGRPAGGTNKGRG